MQQSRVIPRPRSFACDLATLCAPTLAGLKPASLFRYQPAPGQDAAAMAAPGTPRCRPAGSRCGCLGSARAPGLCWSMYTARPVWPGCWQRRTCWTFWRGKATPPAPQTNCWTNWPKGSAAREISRMRSAFFWDTRWRMSSGSSKTAAKLYRVRLLEGLPPTPTRSHRQSFDRYKKCERIYARCYYNGTPIRRLTVAA